MRILLAEDERSLSRALKALLEKNHYIVDAVYDGQEALDYLHCEHYDALILDVMMPRMDGITVLKTIRAEGNHVPVLVLSAKSEVEDKVEGLDAGANDYLTKPFAPAELLARIRAVTRKETVHMDADMHYGNITLSTKTCRLSSSSSSFQLANKEYMIMELFMRNPENIISTEQIIENVWGSENDVETNVVWVYLSYLRKKLNALNADVEIRASRNAGYSLMRNRK